MRAIPQRFCDEVASSYLYLFTVRVIVLKNQGVLTFTPRTGQYYPTTIIIIIIIYYEMVHKVQ